ncbi:GTPase domain-containing protein [Kineosporia sp. J2-2]|uniref:GTPase domain-containing protein n=1 Tax=Kineosporia corallincola TaxID=2835133 RepID=A0ABS5TQ83_9ACTN|nr:GTPase domain-containing protein [Kineosporia corallincola]MBT0773266.1 GTPase domain-containing protein [Kineosporia corallincola]
MRIAMLGHSNSGKTTYVSSMYAALQRGPSGFRLASESGRHHEELLRAASTIRAGGYPPPSSQRSEYAFQLWRRQQSVLDFTWHDYRGGALFERAGDSPETLQLMENLAGADGIVVFVDAHHLATSRHSASQARRLTALSQRAVESRHDVIPVVIVYTKADLVTTDEQWRAAGAPLAALEKAVLESPNIAGMVTRVSCRTGQNVTTPVLWLVSCGLARHVEQLENNARSSTRAAEAARERITLSDSVGSFFRNERSWAQIADGHARDAAQYRSQFRSLRGTSRKLSRAAARAL